MLFLYKETDLFCLTVAYKIDAAHARSRVPLRQQVEDAMSNDVRLANGRQYLAIPGPSVVPDEVLQAMHRPSPNIYAGELVDMVPGLVTDLCKIARTQHNVAIYIANGHGVWEAALANTIAPGDKVLLAVTGSFGLGWGNVASGLGAEVEVIDFGRKTPIDPARIAEALRADTGHTIKAVLSVHVDTSTSLRSDLAAVRAAMDDVGHPALLMADCMASFGCDRFEMDAWGVDVMITGSQKGLMVPAGLAFVFFSDRADACRAGLKTVSPYWDWRPRVDPDVFFQYFFGTAPTHHLYGLRTSLNMILQEGIEHVWARHARLAQAIWAACETWGESGALQLNAQERAHRSHAVTALKLDAPDATRLRDWVEQNLGLTLGIGLGMAAPGDPEWHGYFRLGHMGHVNGHMILGLLGGIEAGLGALSIEHTPGGVAAAAAVIGSNDKLTL